MKGGEKRPLVGEVDIAMNEGVSVNKSVGESLMIENEGRLQVSSRGRGKRGVLSAAKETVLRNKDGAVGPDDDSGSAFILANVASSWAISADQSGA